MRTIEPLGTNILVEPMTIPEKTDGGIIRPQQWTQPSGEAKVVALGNALPDWAQRLAVGDIIIYKWINGQEVNFEGRQLRLLDARELLGVIKA